MRNVAYRSGGRQRGVRGNRQAAAQDADRSRSVEADELRRWNMYSQSAARFRPHESGQAVFSSILPEAVEWAPFASFPPAARIAVLVGEPARSGPYVIRVKLPAGTKLMPHRHPEDRIYTVISGVFYIGLGHAFDPDRLQAYPPGSVVVLPGDTPHFQWAKSGEYVTQVTAIGPLGLEYIDPADDPREPHGAQAHAGNPSKASEDRIGEVR